MKNCRSHLTHCVSEWMVVQCYVVLEHISFILISQNNTIPDCNLGHLRSLGHMNDILDAAEIPCRVLAFFRHTLSNRKLHRSTVDGTPRGAKIYCEVTISLGMLKHLRS